MEINTVEKETNYQAAERALSIALCELGNTDTAMIGPGAFKTTYRVSVPQEFLHIAVPVLLKYINKDLIEKCIKNAQEIALARKVRGWFWWSIASFFASLLCLTIHVSVFLIVLLLLLSICSIVFISRKIVGKFWREVRYSKDEDKTIALEKMIEECKKSSFKICIDYMKNK